jgi:hypothetical protein
VLLDCHPATLRRWISRLNSEGMDGLADRPECGRRRLGGRRLTRRIVALLARPGPWALPRIWRCMGRPQVSMGTLYRRVRLVAIWRRPKLTARGGHRRALDQPLAALGLRAELLECRFSEPRAGFVVSRLLAGRSYARRHISCASERGEVTR